MQDEINSKTVALVINVSKKGAHLTTDMLKAALRKYLRGREQKKTIKRQEKRQEKQHKKLYGKHGKQTVAELMKQNQGLTNIEVTDKNIKSFERVANKYNIDFALKKDMDSEKPKYIVFFKARDVDVMTQAFKEYSTRAVAKSKKPSIRKLLKRALDKSKSLMANLDKNRQRQKNRGQEL